MPVSTLARIVFLSYAHEDEALRARLEVVLNPLVRNGRLELWADHRIGVSRVWRDEIERHLERAELAVLLVSADFLASDYIAQVELPRLVERGVPLVCVPVAACGWHVVEPLERVQWALSPQQGLAAMTPSERDAALLDVFKTLESLVAGLDTSREPKRAPHLGAHRRASSLASSKPGKLVGVPRLPQAYHPRTEDLERLKARLLANADVGLVGRRPSAGLQGPGGVGKSVLAAAACHDAEMRTWFPDGLFWVTLGKHPDLLTHQRDLATELGLELSCATAREGARELKRQLEDVRCLLVVDDAWSTAAADAFAVSGHSGRVLYTTRERAVLADVGAAALTVDVLSPDASLEFLQHSAGPIRPGEEPMVERTIAYTGGSILALSVVAATVRSGRGWGDVTSELEKLTRIFRDHPYAEAFRSMRLAVGDLSAVDADRYSLLGVFPEDVAVPERTVARLWSVDDAAPTLRRLVDADLIVWENRHVQLQDLKRAFVLFEADQSWALAHRQLLEGHTAPDGWASLPDAEPYLWDHLLYHLERAGDYRAMVEVVTHGRWLARRIHRSGPHIAEQDVARVDAAVSAEAGVTAVLHVLRRWPTLFGGDLSVHAVAATLVSRLPSARTSLGSLLGRTWLQPALPLAEPSAGLLRTIVCHDSPVTALALTSDGAIFATGSDDGTARLWSAATGDKLRTLLDGDSPVTAVALARDGATLLTASTEGAVRMWDCQSGDLLQTLPGHSGAIAAMALTADDAMVATAGEDGTVRLFDAGSGRLRIVFEGHAAALTDVVFDAGGFTVASCDTDGVVLMWNAATGEIRRVFRPSTSWVTAVAFSPDGITLATTGGDRRVHIVGAVRGKEHETLRGHTDWVNAVTFAPDGQTLITGADDATVRLWDVLSGMPRHVLSGHTGSVTSVGITADGHTLASAGDDGTVRLWRPPVDIEPRAVVGHEQSVNAVAFSRSGALVATAGEDGVAKLWDGSASDVILTVAGHIGPVNSVVFAPDERALLTGSDDGTIRFWDTSSGKRGRVVTGHTGWVTALTISPDGRTLASTSSDGTIRLWDMTTGNMRRALTGHADWVTAVAFSQAGDVVVTTSSDGTARLWDSATGHVREEIGHGRGPFSAIAFASDDQSIITTGGDGIVRLWDRTGGQQRLALAGHVGSANAVAVCRQRTEFATVGDDGTVRLWEPGSGAEVAAICLGGILGCVALAPAGEVIAVGVNADVVVLQIATSP